MESFGKFSSWPYKEFKKMYSRKNTKGMAKKLFAEIKVIEGSQVLFISAVEQCP